MAAGLCSALSGLSLSTSSRQHHIAPATSFGGTRLPVCLQRRSVSSRGSLVVVAAQNAKKRIRVAERHRQYNKARKSAVATRMKKYLKAVDEVKEVQSEDELRPLQKLLNEAYEEIDKAIVKGIMKKNTGSRRKSRLAKARQRVLIANGLYTPAAS